MHWCVFASFAWLVRPNFIFRFLEENDRIAVYRYWAETNERDNPERYGLLDAVPFQFMKTKEEYGDRHPRDIQAVLAMADAPLDYDIRHFDD